MSVPISSAFNLQGPTDQFERWDSAISDLKADEEKHHENTEADERGVYYYEQLKTNRRELLALIGEYRKSDNDPHLREEIRIRIEREKTITQILEADVSIDNWEADTKRNPQSAPANEQKIKAMKDEMDFLIRKLQKNL